MAAGPDINAAANVTLYAVSKCCTWHGPVTFAAPGKDISFDNGVGTVPSYACPYCGSAVMLQPSAEVFYLGVKRSDRERPGHEAVVRWGQGKCFPDFDTLENAYRQAMEGAQ